MACSDNQLHLSPPSQGGGVPPPFAPPVRTRPPLLSRQILRLEEQLHVMQHAIEVLPVLQASCQAARTAERAAAAVAASADASYRGALMHRN